MASARTSDHQPMPMQATLSGSLAICGVRFQRGGSFLVTRFWSYGRVRDEQRETSNESLFDLIGGADRFHCLARELVVELPGSAGDADATYALAFDDDRVAALHRGP